jgi:hypothetical protein
MQLKYIMVPSTLGIPSPVVFPTTLQHSDVGRGQQVISAGFVELDYETETATAYGESTSLNISSNPEVDTKQLQYHFFDKSF